LYVCDGVSIDILCICCVCFQETEEDLAEAVEYKEARTVLDSVKLEG
jgi:hypothetical protein